VAIEEEANIESIQIENKVELSEHMSLGLKLLLGHIENLHSLTELTLNGCGIGRAGDSLPSPLRAPNLLKLDLSDNFLGTHVVQRNDEGREFVVEACPLFRKFVEDIMAHKKLEDLNLSLNGLDCRASEALVPLFSQEESSIRKLNISQNSLAENGSQSAWLLMQLLSTNTWLQQFSLADVFVKVEQKACVEQLWASLQKNTTLRALNVSGNIFSAEFFKYAFMEGQCALSTLIAQRCNFSLEEFTAVAEVLAKSPRNLDCVSLRDNRINTRLLNSILGAAANNLSKLEVDTPKFVNMQEDLSNFGNALASSGLNTLMLVGWVSFNGVKISPTLSSLGITTVLNISDLGLDASTMAQLLSAVASSPTLEALMIGGNAFDFNTWDALQTAFDIDALQKLRFLSLQGVQILTSECFEIFGLVLSSPIVQQRLNVLDLCDIEWPLDLDDHFWNCLPQDIFENIESKDQFILKMNRITTIPDFEKFGRLLSILQVTELHVDDSSFVLDAFEENVECVARYEKLTHLSMRTSAPISASNEAVLMLVACHKLQALRLPAFLQDHILEDIFVLAEEHESLCVLETQYEALQNAMRCSLAVRSLRLGKAEFEKFKDYQVRLEIPADVTTPSTFASSDV